MIYIAVLFFVSSYYIFKIDVEQFFFNILCNFLHVFSDIKNCRRIAAASLVRKCVLT